MVTMCCISRWPLPYIPWWPCATFHGDPTYISWWPCIEIVFTMQVKPLTVYQKHCGINAINKRFLCYTCNPGELIFGPRISWWPLTHISWWPYLHFTVTLPAFLGDRNSINQSRKSAKPVNMHISGIIVICICICIYIILIFNYLIILSIILSINLSIYRSTW